jgi:hypothetical protein
VAPEVHGSDVTSSLQVPAPTQQSASVTQGSNCCLQVGGSQVQVVSPGTEEQAVTTPLPSRKTQASPAQQAASAVQRCACGVQVSGTWQVPPRQSSSAEQQSALAWQLSPVEAQVAPVPQVPEVAPAGMSQARPAQQSPFTVQAPLEEMQGGAQDPPTQLPEQQSMAVVQAVPFTLQVAGWVQVQLSWAPRTQVSGAQQEGSSAPAQLPPVGVQEETEAQRSTPAASGTQGEPLQHWSRNWQT